jgi:hypothetical protein
MLHPFLAALALAAVLEAGPPADPPPQSPEAAPLTPDRNRDCLVFPGGSSPLQLRLYTNAAPTAEHVFNTFALDGWGESLLASPTGAAMAPWREAGRSMVSPHNVLLDDAGPELGETNCLRLIERAAGRDWQYVGLDLTDAYRGRADRYRRGLLFVEPDLIVLHDHIVAPKPIRFQFLLNPPAVTVVDPVWGDLRLALPGAALRVNAPASKRSPRPWQRLGIVPNPGMPGTVAMRLAPTNRLAQVDLIVVLAVTPAGTNADYAFKLLESDTAVGTRILRHGLPTLVAFRTDSTATTATLAGFPFQGPVGVDVFRPRQRKP